MGKPTIQDVAETAQVSLATVDRVLNRRGGVAEKSVRKVEQAVMQLDYVRDEAAALMGGKRGYRFCFVLPGGKTGFAALLREAVAAEAPRWAGARVTLDVVEVPSFDVAAQVAALRDIEADAVAVMATETPEVSAEIVRLSSAGVPVVTLVADVAGSARAAYVGPDNVRAGRVAAEFMGRFTGGQGHVLMIAGSLVARDHAERLLGFRRVMRDRFAGIALCPEVEGGDDADRVEGIVRAATQDRPLAGIYAIGAGNRGLLRALGDGASRPVVIAHELTDASREALAKGQIDLVLDQDPRAEVARAIDIMRELSLGRELAPGAGETNVNIFVRENVR